MGLSLINQPASGLPQWLGKVKLMICNRFSIRGGLVEESVLVSLKISWQFLWQSVLPHDFATNSFVRFSSKIRCFNSNLTKFGRYFWRFFLWQNVVAKRFATTFCHKKNRQKYRPNFVKIIVQISSNLSWSNEIFDEILTKEFAAKSCGKTFCHKAPDEKSNEIPTKGKSMKQRHKSLYQKILQVVAFHGGSPLQPMTMETSRAERPHLDLSCRPRLWTRPGNPSARGASRRVEKTSWLWENHRKTTGRWRLTLW